MTIRKTALAVLLALAGMSAAATAETSLSQSNDPRLMLDDQMQALMGAERLGLARLDKGTLRKLGQPPGKGGTAMKVRYEADWIDALPAVKDDDPELACLAEALYFEARGETIKGQFAVAEVIANRVESPAFPDTVCGVVHQGTGKRFQCQFTYTCDGRAETIANPSAWERARKIAALVLSGAPRTLTKGATHYHTTAVNPSWAARFERTAELGVHRFYRMPDRVASR